VLKGRDAVFLQAARRTGFPLRMLPLLSFSKPRCAGDFEGEREDDDYTAFQTWGGLAELFADWPLPAGPASAEDAAAAVPARSTYGAACRLLAAANGHRDGVASLASPALAAAGASQDAIALAAAGRALVDAVEAAEAAGAVLSLDSTAQPALRSFSEKVEDPRLAEGSLMEGRALELLAPAWALLQPPVVALNKSACLQEQLKTMLYGNEDAYPGYMYAAAAIVLNVPPWALRGATAGAASASITVGERAAAAAGAGAGAGASFLSDDLAAGMAAIGTSPL
jgi:hypothetical protein